MCTNDCILGSPCAKQNNRCMHGICEEIKHGGDFKCYCDKGFTGNNFYIYLLPDLFLSYLG